MTKKNPHWGTMLDTFLSEEGIREAAKTEALRHPTVGRPGDRRLRSRAGTVIQTKGISIVKRP